MLPAPSPYHHVNNYTVSQKITYCATFSVSQIDGETQQELKLPCTVHRQELRSTCQRHRRRTRDTQSRWELHHCSHGQWLASDNNHRRRSRPSPCLHPLSTTDSSHHHRASTARSSCRTVTYNMSATTPQPSYGPFSGPPRWAGARRELLDFMVQGKINRGRHTDHPAGRHSVRTNQYPPPPSPHFLQAGCLSCHPTNSVKALKANLQHVIQLNTVGSRWYNGWEIQLVHWKSIWGKWVIYTDV